MNRTILFSGGSKYDSLITNKYKQDGGTIVRLVDSADPETDIVWNKRSPLSARNALLSVLNKYDSLDEAILCYQPGGFNKTFHETSSAVYDLQIDRWIKGYGYLLKELIQFFLKQQSGQISFILDTNGMKVMTPLEGAIFSYLKTMLQNLSVLYQNEPFRIHCFETDTNRKEDFIEYFYKTINESRYVPGKINRFGDKKSLFDFGRN